MNDFHNHNRDNLIRPIKVKPSQKKRELTALDKEIDAYIMSNDEDYPLLKLAKIIKSLKIQPQKAKQVLKDAIRINIKDYDNKLDDYSLYLTKGLESWLKDFNISEFVERTWQYKPIVLKEKDYLLLQEKEKYPIYINSYDYSIPIHKFGNNINFQNETNFKKKKIDNSNDVQFYTTKEENMLFAKVTNIKFEPISYSLIKKVGHELPPEDKNKLKFDPRLYNRTFSISLYTLLDGDPKKSHPFIRYDSSYCTHTNLFMKNDKRIDVYGVESDNPHFHFQNEDDALLCIRKYRDNNRRIKWKTGKCNAIDCKHLIKYLLKLDNMAKEELDKLDKQNLNYGMPFLNLKLKGKRINTVSFEKILNIYPCLREEDSKFIESLRSDFRNRCFVNSDGENKNFQKLIMSLQFLQFVHDGLSTTFDYSYLEILSNLEVECASNIINAISNCSQKIIEKDYKPKFSIDNCFINKDKGDEKE